MRHGPIADRDVRLLRSAAACLSLAAVGAALGWVSLAVLGAAAGLPAASLGVVWWLLAGRGAQASYRAAAPLPQSVGGRAPA